jgi:EAL domain-containing protein (putative c-di-GMP-specific phosphodiesterase class I)/CRP-like cAMP-binding protein
MQPVKKTELKIDFHHIRAHYKKGAVIFRESDARDNAYIIENGTVEISTQRQGAKVPLVNLSAGEVFGETALLGTGKRTATAMALEDTEVFIIPPGLVHDRIMHLDPLVGLLLTLLVNRYRQWRYRAPGEQTHANTEAGLSVAGGKADAEGEGAAGAFLRDLNAQKDIALNELRLAQEITQAVDAGQFKPWLQPIVTLPDRKLVGFEALVRWDHPKRGLVPPMDFIPVAERTHAVRDIDMAMLKAACTLAPQLQQAAEGSGRLLYVSVNLSGIHFEDASIVAEIGNIVEKSGVDPRQLVFEITEGALMGDPSAAEKVLQELKKVGGRIALDDFGTGYSSLSYLHRFPFDLLKIDRAFVREVATNKKSADIVRAIVALARTFHLQIVGEGIENEHEIDLLAGIGCDYGQGYCFSRPIPADRAPDYVRDSVKKYG